MRPINRFEIAPATHSGGKRHLLRDGEPTGLEIGGSILEAQFALADGGTLLFLTDDSPYDEGLHIYRLGPEGDIQDCAEASAPFTPGLFRLEDVGEDWVQFRFHLNEALYRLSLIEKPQFGGLPPRGWRYKPALGKRRLRIERVKEGKK